MSKPLPEPPYPLHHKEWEPQHYMFGGAGLLYQIGWTDIKCLPSSFLGRNINLDQTSDVVV